ncbi:MAG: SGNH/GDSL hydrolase family protein [Burkholderiales bacterium]|nr:SGNH/GDSL hydrolase family protein [Burkholderiales bacterium]
MTLTTLMTRAFGALALTAACSCAPALAGPYSSLYAFGDSLSDVGNDALLTGGAIPNAAIYTDGTTSGRFTNGRNYIDLLGADLGVGIAPSVSGGTVYAYGGARTDSIQPGLAALGGLSFNQQIAQFDSTHAAADPNALYLIWIGANDMSDAITAAALGNPGAIGSAITGAMSSIGAAIGNLASKGATHFLIPNLPDLSLTPAINGYGNPGLSALAHGASIGFDQALAALLQSFGGLDIRGLDIFDDLNAVVADPATYGFTNTTQSCYTGDVTGAPLPGGPPPTVCAHPDQYLFWDYEHPTAALDAIIAAKAYAVAIPEPAAIWVVVALAAAWATRRRRRVPFVAQ